jgi:putrescine transport system ATP-binding protein
MAAVEKTTKQPQHKHAGAAWTDPKAEPYIRVENVTKKFGEFVAVNNVSLNIYRGELFSLLGGSGCGKTTLLRMLAGFENPTSGKIYIDGVDMAGIPPYDRPTNMMFQSYALFPHMTVEQNVSFGLKQDKYPESEIKQRVSQMLDMVQLTPFAKRKPHHCPAVSASASPSPGRWSSSRSCCCWTSRSARSTRSCARRRSSS